MTALRRLLLLASVVLAVSLVGAPIPRAGAADDTSIVDQVKSAKTPAEHEAIAKRYDAQAAAARRNAAAHEQMADSYRAMASSIGKGSGASSMPQHCESLVKTFEAEAADYEAMAQAHRALAKAK
jgi:hypothetical protein